MRIETVFDEKTHRSPSASRRIRRLSCARLYEAGLAGVDHDLNPRVLRMSDAEWEQPSDRRDLVAQLQVA